MLRCAKDKLEIVEDTYKGCSDAYDDVISTLELVMYKIDSLATDYQDQFKFEEYKKRQMKKGVGSTSFCEDH